MSEGEAAARCGACPAHAEGPSSRAAYAGCGVAPVSASNVPFQCQCKGTSATRRRVIEAGRAQSAPGHLLQGISGVATRGFSRGQKTFHDLGMDVLYPKFLS